MLWSHISYYCRNHPLRINMPIHDLLLTEFDEEINKTRTMLERVPEDRKDFAPHPK